MMPVGTATKQADAQTTACSSISSRLNCEQSDVSGTASVSAPATKSNHLSRDLSNLDRQQRLVTTAAGGVVSEVRRTGFVASNSLAARP